MVQVQTGLAVSRRGRLRIAIARPAAYGLAAGGTPPSVRDLVRLYEGDERGPEVAAAAAEIDGQQPGARVGPRS